MNTTHTTHTTATPCTPAQTAQTLQATAPSQTSCRLPQRKRSARIASGVASVLVSTVLFGLLLSGFDTVSGGPGLMAQGTVGAVAVQHA